jgi:hypothetical protein
MRIRICGIVTCTTQDRPMPPLRRLQPRTVRWRCHRAYHCGVNPADQWGTQTAAYTSDFSVNADSWAQNIGNALLPQPETLTAFLASTIRCDLQDTDTDSVALQVRRNSALVTTERYRISLDYFAETGSGLQFLGLGFFGTRYDAGSSAVLENAWQTGVSLEAVIPQTLLPVASFTTSTGTSTSAFAVPRTSISKNFVCHAGTIGAIDDLDCTVGTGYQATRPLDQRAATVRCSTGVLSLAEEAPALVTRPSTNGNQQMLGTLAIPTNAIIEDIIVNSTKARLP